MSSRKNLRRIPARAGMFFGLHFDLHAKDTDKELGKNVTAAHNVALFVHFSGVWDTPAAPEPTTMPVDFISGDYSPRTTRSTAPAFTADTWPAAVCRGT